MFKFFHETKEYKCFWLSQKKKKKNDILRTQYHNEVELFLFVYWLIAFIYVFKYIFLGIKYDAEKEEKSLQDSKQKELSRIEEALQKAAEKGTISLYFR